MLSCLGPRTGGRGVNIRILWRGETKAGPKGSVSLGACWLKSGPVSYLDWRDASVTVLLAPEASPSDVLTCVGAFIYERPQEGHVPGVHNQEEEEGADIAPRETLGGLMGSCGAQLSPEAKF